MKRSNRLVLLVGIFLAVVAFVLIALMLGGGGGGSGTPNPSAAPTTVKLVVAARDLPVGAKIRSADLTTKDIAVASRPAGTITEPTIAVGQTVRVTVTKDQFITAEIWGAGGSIKTLDVPPGKVAMSVKVDQVSGVGTIIKPGDYVDAVVAFKIQPLTVDPDSGQPAPLGEGIDAGPSVKALLQGMQVLGTLLPPPPAAQPNATPASSSDETAFNDQQEIVILAVTLQQAEVLNYAQIQGAVVPNGITLVLRSSADFQDAAGQPSIPPDTLTTGIILRILVDEYGVLVPDFGTIVESPAP